MQQPDKCPKCGSAFQTHKLNFARYRCGTRMFDNGSIEEDRACLRNQRDWIKEQMADIKAELDECTRRLSEFSSTPELREYIQSFIDTACELSPEYTTTAGDLYKAYLRYCESVNDRPLSQTRFGRLVALNPAITKSRQGGTGTKTYTGIRIKQEFLNQPLPGNKQNRSSYHDDTEGDIEDGDLF